MNEPMNPLEQKLSNFLTEEAQPGINTLLTFDELKTASRRKTMIKRTVHSGIAGLAVAASIAGVMALQSSDSGRSVRAGVTHNGGESTSSTSKRDVETSSSSAAAPANTIAKDGEYIAAVLDDRVVILDRSGTIQKTLGTAPRGLAQGIYWTPNTNSFVLLSTNDGCDHPFRDDKATGTTLTTFNVDTGTSSELLSIKQFPYGIVAYVTTEGLLPIYGGCDVRPTYVVDVVNHKEAVCAEFRDNASLMAGTTENEIQQEMKDVRTWQGGHYPDDPSICTRLAAAGGSRAHNLAPSGDGLTAADGSKLARIEGHITAEEFTHYDLVAANGSRNTITKDRERATAYFVPAGTDLGVLGTATTTPAVVSPPSTSTSSAAAPVNTIAKEGEYIAAVIDDRVVVLDRRGKLRKTLGATAPGVEQKLYWTGANTLILYSSNNNCGEGFDPAATGITLTKFDVTNGTSSQMFAIAQDPADTIGYLAKEGLLPIYSGCDVRPTYVVDVPNLREAVCAEFTDNPAVMAGLTESEIQKMIQDIRTRQGGHYPDDPSICTRLAAAGGSYAVNQIEGLTAADGSKLERSSEYGKPAHFELVAANGTRTAVTKDRARVAVHFIPAGTDIGVLTD